MTKMDELEDGCQAMDLVYQKVFNNNSFTMKKKNVD